MRNAGGASYNTKILETLIGKNIIEIDRVDSTNAWANVLYQQKKVTDGDVIWAREQFAGRGQHDHTWESEPGKNLTFSIILRPAFLPADQQFLLNKAISLAAIDFLEVMLAGFPHPDLTIKWPNDLYIGLMKIGGILIEHKIMGMTLNTSVVGIGLNINQLIFSDSLPNPESLIRLLKRETNLKVALAVVCRILDRRYQGLKSGRSSTLDLEFDRRLLGYRTWRTFKRDEMEFEGKTIGVNSLGQLMLELRSGEIKTLNHLEVDYVL